MTSASWLQKFQSILASAAVSGLHAVAPHPCEILSEMNLDNGDQLHWGFNAPLNSLKNLNFC